MGRDRLGARTSVERVHACGGGVEKNKTNNNEKNKLAKVKTFKWGRLIVQGSRTKFSQELEK